MPKAWPCCSAPWRNWACRRAPITASSRWPAASPTWPAAVPWPPATWPRPSAIAACCGKPDGPRVRPASDNSPTGRAPLLIVVLLAGLTSLGPFSIDTYLPSFQAIEVSLGADLIAVQQTLTAYMLPFTLMTLWHGALSDALGRKRVILFFLGLYVAASFFAAAADHIEYLWLARVCQGLTAG